MSHRAVALIDGRALRENVEYLDQVSGDAALMIVVKGDAYGHGMVPVASIVRGVGVPWLGVALLSEALTLRAAGDIGRILAWLWAPQDPDLGACIDADVDIGVSSEWALEAVIAAGRQRGKRPRIQLKLDTGLSRNGIGWSDWTRIVELAAAHQDDVCVEGVWSHLANADAHTDVNARATVDAQRKLFQDGLDVVHSAGLEPRCIHLANSAGTLWFEDARFTMVRCGIATYGVSPGARGDEAIEIGLRPVMTLRAQLALCKTIPAGQSVSYGSTWTAKAPTRIGLVPVGYADGIPRIAEGAQVTVHGERADVIGRIAMDQFVIRIPDGLEVAAGDWVTVFGAGGPSADDWAAAAHTIGYEIVTRIGSRVPREVV
jgi:alanine racemase